MTRCRLARRVPRLEKMIMLRNMEKSYKVMLPLGW